MPIMEVMMNDNDMIEIFMMIKISRRRSIDEESNMAKWMMMACLVRAPEQLFKLNPDPLIT